jgi:hypothetical protein
VAVDCMVEETKSLASALIVLMVESMKTINVHWHDGRQMVINNVSYATHCDIIPYNIH